MSEPSGDGMGFARRNLLALTVGLIVASPSRLLAAAGDVPSGISSALRDLQAEERRGVADYPLRIRNVNTGERLDIPVARQGEDGLLAWEPEALARLDWLLRDWREGASIQIDRRLYVFLFLLQALSERLHGTRSLIELTSGFRTERTNARLRGVYRETVALNSFHTRGQAVDFRVAGLSTRLCASLAWALNMGGVGLYGDSFVHCDTGPRRRWGDPFPT